MRTPLQDNMPRLLLLTLVSIMTCIGFLWTANNTSAEQIYRVVGEDGKVTFTDVDPKNGTRPEVLNEGNDFAAQKQSRDRGRIAPPQQWSGPDQEKPITYTSVAIANIADDQAIRANDGNISFTVRSTPTLGSNHQYRVRVDGQALEGSGSSFSKTNMTRGTHQVVAEIIDANGAVLKSSSPVTFHVLKARAR